MTTVIHIEDDPLWADFARKVIGTCPEFLLLGTAGTGGEGIARCRKLRPNIVVLDLRLPDMDGLELIDQLGALESHPRLLLFTARADDAVMARLFREPIAGMLWKSSDAEIELRKGLALLADGGTHYAVDTKRAWRRFNAAPH